MKEILTVGNRTFEVAGPLTPELKAQVIQQIMNKVQGGGGGCPSCAGAMAAGGIPRLGTAVCGGPYIKGSQHTLTGSVTSGGTSPFIYGWTITPPTGSVEVLAGASQTYTFALAGTYKILLAVSDSCAGGAKTDSVECNVTVTDICVNPVCKINIV